MGGIPPGSTVRSYSTLYIIHGFVFILSSFRGKSLSYSSLTPGQFMSVTMISSPCSMIFRLIALMFIKSIEWTEGESLSLSSWLCLLQKLRHV